MVRHSTAKGFSYILPGIILVLVIGVLILNGSLFFRMTNTQAEILGRERLEVVSAQLQGVLKNAEASTWRVADGMEQLLDNNAPREDLLQYCSDWQQDLASENCINVFIAGEDWYAIPNDIAPEDFQVTQRVWYLGARKRGVGSVYVSTPYLDAVSGNMCFTMSVMLRPDGIVLGVDYNLAPVQQSILEITSSGGDALVISSDGMIVGYPDESVIGKTVSEALPQYTNLFQRILSSGEESMAFRTEIGGTDSTVFYHHTTNDWYLISAVSDWELHRGNYLQLLRNSALNLILALIILLLYVSAYRTGIRAEEKLKAQEKYLAEVSANLQTPFKTIIDYSKYENLRRAEDPREYMEKIREAAFRLEQIDVAFRQTWEHREKELTEKSESRLTVDESVEMTDKRGRLFFASILMILLFTMVAAIVITSGMTTQSGNDLMIMEAQNYLHETNLWMSHRKSILDMFVQNIGANPEILDDYDGAVEWLDEMTKRYDEISVAYMTNPEAEHTVIMNNGWESAAGWRVEGRPWYIKSQSSETEDGFNVSVPYYDAQTGDYCVTFSERVYDASGNFLGIFGIDFYLDQLTGILNRSYSDVGYAFLAGSDGKIISHPNAAYELNAQGYTTVEHAGYLHAIYSSGPVEMRDYDGKKKVVMATVEPLSGYSVIVVQDWKTVYGEIIRYDILFFLLFGGCVLGVWSIVQSMVSWQRHANELLRESVARAEQAGKAKTDFLAQMSHEIRTPINAILGLNEMISRESTEDNVLSYAENIESSGRTLMSLINGVLDLSKIEDGKMEIVPVNYDTASMINDLVHMISTRAAKKGLELKLEIDQELPQTLFGDDVRVRQVIMNLLTNAVKYTEKGSVTLRMRALEHTPDFLKLHVEVEDTGLGIRDEDKESIFESFHRVNLLKTRTIEGTGLGLPIVQRLLEMMGSTLELESEYGKGSRFWFDLDQRVISDEPIGNYEEHPEGSRRHRKRTEYVYAPSARVLFVDDNQTNLIVDRGLLKRSGIQVETVLTGEECIDRMKTGNYDILFLDHMMPGMDGMETYRKLTELDLIPRGTRVIMMTANAVSGAREEYLHAGFDDYLAKPVEADDIEELLEKYIRPEKVQHKTIPVKLTTVPEDQGPDKLVDRATGLKYCGDDESFYRMAADSWLNSGHDHKLQEALEQEDWKSYQVTVHGLKSTSLALGAKPLSDLAKELELSLKNGEGPSLVLQKHGELLALYYKTADILKGV